MGFTLRKYSADVRFPGFRSLIEGSRTPKKSNLEAKYGALGKFFIAKTTRDKDFGIKSDCIKQILESYFPKPYEKPSLFKSVI